MSPEQKREAIKDVYKSASWDLKVSKMSDAQVSAIYTRMLSKGQL